MKYNIILIVKNFEIFLVKVQTCTITNPNTIPLSYLKILLTFKLKITIKGIIKIIRKYINEVKKT